MHRLDRLLPRFSRLVGLTAVFTLTFVPPGGAQIIDCQGIRDTQGMKVLLDDIIFESEVPGFQQAMPRLRFTLDTALQELRLDQAIELKVLRCEGRRPRGESDFTPDLINVLQDREVILEVWGNVLSATNSKARGCEALVGYALIPVRSRDRTVGIYEVEHSSAVAGPSDRLLDLFRRNNELLGFAAVSVGLHRLQAKKYDQARRYFCRAESLLAKNKRPDNRLLVYIRNLGREVIDAARRDQSYKGLLRLQGIGACYAAP